LKDQLLKIRDSIKSEDLATIIYTSGTTGNPKGVMLSHKNILGNIRGIMQVFNLNHTQRTLSFLPISHIFERTINYYFQQIGLSVYYAENLGAIGNNIKEIKPHVLIAVPRVLRAYLRQNNWPRQGS
jgi:long-chain acyl-CoA synthetase